LGWLVSLLCQLRVNFFNFSRLPPAGCPFCIFRLSFSARVAFSQFPWKTGLSPASFHVLFSQCRSRFVYHVEFPHFISAWAVLPAAVFVSIFPHFHSPLFCGFPASCLESLQFTGDCTPRNRPFLIDSPRPRRFLEGTFFPMNSPSLLQLFGSQGRPRHL